MYCLGSYFFNGEEVVKTNASEDYSLQVSAYGPMLCVARIEFTDGKQVVLQRYIDFDLEEDAA